jgi:hypothetical protein
MAGYGPYRNFQEAQNALGDLAYVRYGGVGGGADDPWANTNQPTPSDTAWGGNQETGVTGNQNLYTQPAADEFNSGFAPEAKAGDYTDPWGNTNQPTAGSGSLGTQSPTSPSFSSSSPVTGISVNNRGFDTANPSGTDNVLVDQGGIKGSMTLGEAQALLKTQGDDAQKQWETRLGLTTDAQSKAWNDQFAASNAEAERKRLADNEQWFTRMGITNAADQKAWETKLGMTTEAQNKTWQEQFAMQSAADKATWAERFAAQSAQQLNMSAEEQKQWESRFAQQANESNAQWEIRFAKERESALEMLRMNLEAAQRPTTTTPTIPTSPFPEGVTLSPFSAPTRDTARVEELTKQKSASGLRAMRSAIQKAMGQTYRNANVKRMSLREALAGYGQGIESVMSGAQSQAGSEYQKEYEQQYDVGLKNWQADYNAKFQDWNNKIQNYFKGYGSTTTR